MLFLTLQLSLLVKVANKLNYLFFEIYIYRIKFYILYKTLFYYKITVYFGSLIFVFSYFFHFDYFDLVCRQNELNDLCKTKTKNKRREDG